MAQLATPPPVVSNTAPSGRDVHGLTPRAAWWIRWMPIFIIAPLLPFVATERTREAFYWLVSEMRPVELVTFIAMMMAVVVGVRLVLHLRRTGTSAWVWLFYAVFTLGMFVTAMEEIAWGQWIFHWRTPEFWDKLNAQHETTLHNINGLQGKTEFFRLFFVVGALVGLLIGRVKSFAPIALPAVLWSWVLIMLAQVVADIVNDHVDLGPNFFIDRMSEVVEMMIGVVAYLYLRLNATKLGKLPAARV
jgi:hypothetical protein